MPKKVMGTLGKWVVKHPKAVGGIMIGSGAVISALVPPLIPVAQPLVVAGVGIEAYQYRGKFTKKKRK